MYAVKRGSTSLFYVNLLTLITKYDIIVSSKLERGDFHEKRKWQCSKLQF